MAPVNRAARGWAAVVLVGLAAMAAQAFGRFTYGVLLPAVRDDLGLSNTVAGLLATLNVAAYLLGTIIIVRATARVRLLALMRTGLVLSTVGLLVAALAPGGPVLVVGLVLMGLGGACIWIPSPSLAAAEVPPERRGLAVGVIGAGIGIGIVFAGRLANTLRERLGDGAWDDVYLVEAVIGAVVAVAVILLLRPEAEPAPNRSGSSFAVLRTMDGWAPLTAAYAAFGFSYLMALTYMTARLEDDAGWTDAQAAGAFAVAGLAGIVGGIVLGALADRVGPRLVLVGGFVCLSGGIAGILSGTPALVFMGAAIIGMTFGGIPSVIAAYIVEHSTVATYGPRYAVATLAFGIAQVSSPQVGGFIADLTGAFTVVFMLSAVLALIGAGASWMLPRRTRDRAPAAVRD